jgi:hypothetical protein
MTDEPIVCCVGKDIFEMNERESQKLYTKH